MKVLIDTHVFIWWVSNPGKISPVALSVLNDPANVICMSVASIWELVIKTQLGKLGLGKPLKDVVLRQQQSNAVQVLPITSDHALAVQSLPPLHKDPFDRLIIAAAMTDGATILSADRQFAQYPVKVIW